MATETYVFRGSKKRPWDRTSRIIIEGSSTNPEKYLDRDGEAVELDEETVDRLRKQGWSLTKSGEKDEGDGDPQTAETPAQQQEAQKPPAGGVGTAPGTATASGKSGGKS